MKFEGFKAMETKFKPGDIALYTESPPNWEKMRKLCVWTDQAIARAQKEWEKHTATVEILEVYPYDEEGQEPEQYKIKFLTSPDNPQLEEVWKGYGYAEYSELRPR